MKTYQRFPWVRRFRMKRTGQSYASVLFTGLILISTFHNRIDLVSTAPEAQRWLAQRFSVGKR
jgi:hypothetical protein